MKLPKVESLIILVFFFCIGLWAISKCSSKRSQIVKNVRESLDEEERPVKRDTVYVPQAQTQQTAPAPPPHTTTPGTGGGVPQLQQTPAASTPAAPAPGPRPTLSNQPAPAQTTNTPTASKYSTLFVTIDGLKVRKEPHLKGAVVAKLKLDEQVYFLNKKSEKPEEINLGYETVTDYWVKIRTKSGKEGWVFGAGVHYYKMKRKGVVE